MLDSPLQKAFLISFLILKSLLLLAEEHEGAPPRFSFYGESLYFSQDRNFLTQNKMEFRYFTIPSRFDAILGVASSLDTQSNSSVVYFDRHLTPLVGLKLHLPFLPITVFFESRFLTRPLQKPTISPGFEIEFREGSFFYDEKTLHAFSPRSSLFTEIYWELISSSTTPELLWQVSPKIGHRLRLKRSTFADFYLATRAVRGAFDLSPGARLTLKPTPLTSVSLSIQKWRASNQLQWTPLLVLGGDF